ncbi:hypothetical protein OsI_30368 [Oryza sativa Indica Group]|uniref:Uncharacterized protein n=1 Tax=Oryza sativa subsp. indica TaxID=39946 RepID=A2YYE2_ORYSI|nr:hypothetical protein OsI_30368 [Oryza sativa Indica Group]
MHSASATVLDRDHRRQLFGASSLHAASHLSSQNTSDLPLPSWQIIVLPKADADLGHRAHHLQEKGQKATDFFSDSLFTSAGRSGSGKAGCVGSRADQDGRLDGREVRDGGISSGGPRGNTGPSITVDTEMEQPRQLKGRPPQLGRMREVSSAAGGNDFWRFRGGISGDSAAVGCDLRREDAISEERRRRRLWMGNVRSGWRMCRSGGIGGSVIIVRGW